jgi:hypothetical protein
VELEQKRLMEKKNQAQKSRAAAFGDCDSSLASSSEED